MAAPMGTWNMNANGNTGTLTLSTSSSGGITGTLSLAGSPADPITAVWDETSQILSFSRASQDGGPKGNTFAFEVYTGTLLQPYDTSNGAITGEGVPLMLAGNFGTFAMPSGPFGPTDHLGWFALNTVKFKEKEKEAKEGKDVKDGKDGKDHKDKDVKDHKEKEPADLPPFSQQSLPQAEMAAAMQTEATGEVRVATGKSFIPAEERPRVGQSALQTANEPN